MTCDSNLDAKALASFYRDTLLDDVVPFWTDHSPDREMGGFCTFLDRDGSLYCDDKPVWLQGRIPWMYSKLYNTVEKRPEWLDLARLGIDFALKHCFDSDGRMYFIVTRDGTPLRKRRYLFSETFIIMALAEYAKATGEDWARAKAAEVFDTLIRYHTTPGLCEPKFVPGTRDAKAHAMPMILLCTAQVIRQVDDRPIYKQVADQALEEVFGDFLKPEKKALLEMVGPNGEFIDTPEGRTVNPGHAIETAWFIMEEARSRNDQELAMKALPILDYSLEIGWDKDFGGIFYFVDVDDKPCVQYEWDMKLWWPHTEAIYATLLAHHLTGDKKWADWHKKVHDYAFSHFADPECGEWFGYLHRDGTVSHRLKGNGWKGPYHLSRTLLLSWKLLEGQGN